MLTIEDVSVRRTQGRDWVLRRFNLHVGPGECCALVGHSGAGKTALLEAVMGLRPCVGGEIRVGAASPNEPPAIRRRRITAIWGTGAVDDARTVRQNISLILQVAGAPAPARTQMDQLLRVMELPDRVIDRPASGLSGAERFSMWLAVARLRQTPVLLLDDPTPAWTVSEVANVIPLIRDLCASGMTALLATRDTDLACAVADRVCVMDEGRTLAEGAPGLVFGTAPPDRSMPDTIQS